MRRRLGLFLGLALLGTVNGCRNCDLVEAELRTLERDLSQIRDELFRSEAHNDALHRELRALRQGGDKTTPEAAAQKYSLRQLVLGRGTGGTDDDGVPGDDGLQVVIEPRDGDGHAIKAGGVLYVEAVEITPEGLKAPLSTWELSPDQLRRTWRSGLLSSGYHVALPWKAWPSSEKVRVVARLTLDDGRAFEADRDVTIRLTPAAKRKALPAPSAPPPGPELELPLPLPRKVEPEKPTATQARWWDPAPSQVASADAWQAKKAPPLNEAIQLLRPVPLPAPPMRALWNPVPLP
jgi:hypothetical protein